MPGSEEPLSVHSEKSAQSRKWNHRLTPDVSADGSVLRIADWRSASAMASALEWRRVSTVGEWFAVSRMDVKAVIVLVL